MDVQGFIYKEGDKDIWNYLTVELICAIFTIGSIKYGQVTQHHKSRHMPVRESQPKI